eukprot:1154062-Pelagomonas_calceolata.AAC.6
MADGRVKPVKPVRLQKSTKNVLFLGAKNVPRGTSILQPLRLLVLPKMHKQIGECALKIKDNSGRLTEAVNHHLTSCTKRILEQACTFQADVQPEQKASHDMAIQVSINSSGVALLWHSLKKKVLCGYTMPRPQACGSQPQQGQTYAQQLQPC